MRSKQLDKTHKVNQHSTKTLFLLFLSPEPSSHMAASSSVATRIGPQVFISFRGEDVRNHFVSFLDPALRRANINVFLDENELLNTDLARLLTRIEESEIAMVIFSKNYPDSDRSLDGLAKMKELRDQGRLIVIPIFYNLDPLVVKELRGDFGDKFRDLQRIHLHQLERIQKWEEALVTILNIRGMPRAEQRLIFCFFFSFGSSYFVFYSLSVVAENFSLESKLITPLDRS